MRAAILIGCLLAASAFAGPRPHFVRTKPAKQRAGGSFQTAVIRYHKATAPVDVVLCSVVHLGEPRYFERVQKLLAASDLVLYEAVQLGNDAHPVPATNRWGDPATMLANMLGLVHQAAALDYERANFVWADVSLDELLDKGGQDLMNGLLGGGPTAAAAAMGASAATLVLSMLDPARARAELAQMLARAFDDLPAILGDQLSRPLIEMRNQRLLAVVDKQLGRLAKGKLTILFGAGHMPDLDRTLQARGYAPVETWWLTAWNW